MKKIFFRLITFLIILIFFKLIFNISPMLSHRYYTEKTFKGFVYEVENNSTITLEKLIFYCIHNYDTEKEKNYNLKLLRCYSYKISFYNKMKKVFKSQIYLEKYSAKKCPSKPLNLLNGNYSIFKYILYMLEFNQTPP